LEATERRVAAISGEKAAVAEQLALMLSKAKLTKANRKMLIADLTDTDKADERSDAAKMQIRKLVGAV
jgi:hypothetical protein